MIPKIMYVSNICYVKFSEISFAAYTLSHHGNILTAEKAFVSLAYFNIMKNPLHQIPDFINFCISCYVSHMRIYNFLLKEEIDPEGVIRVSENSGIYNLDIKFIIHQNIPIHRLFLFI